MRMFQESDMIWLANEYRRRRDSEPSLTVEEFAEEYGLSADELRAYMPELNEGYKRSVVVWHGTSRSRAESIREEGFKPGKMGKGRTFFTRSPNVARGYARRRAKNESDQPAVIKCSIDLNHYNDYIRPSSSVFAFRQECIDSQVVRGVSGIEREPRKKKQKRKDADAKLTDVAITFNSGCPGIAYWINSCLKLNGQSRIDENHEAVVKIKEWLDAESDAGRFGEVPDEEMLEQVRKYFPET